MNASTEVVLNAIVAPPSKLLEISGFDNNQCSSFVAKKGFLIVTINLGTKRERLGFIVEIEVLDELAVLAVDELRLSLGEGCHKTRLLRRVCIGETTTMQVFVVVLNLVIRGAFARVGIRKGEVLYIVEMRL